MKFSLPIACQQTGTPYSAAYRAIISGTVPAKKINGGWFIDEADLPALKAAGAPKSRRAA